ncbi:MAG: hypothetical protein RLY31_1677 [Bacteroidota bacterium]
MCHADMMDWTRKGISDWPLSGGIRCLDMGCGDAFQLSSILPDFHVASYEGWDLSPAAVEWAADRLARTGIPFRFAVGDMEELLRVADNPFNLIHSSYAVHHLQDDAKKRLIQSAFDLLLPGGRLILVDIFRTKDQSREAYIDAYLSRMYETWSLLSDPEFEMVRSHVESFDFPARLEDMFGWLRQAGFILLFHHSPDGSHHVLVAEKPVA